MDAILVGGPRDGTFFDPEDASLVELDINGVRHRYVVTTEQRHGHQLYTYAGTTPTHRIPSVPPVP
ncbi:hypothetical protein [Micromonospora sp. CPCC 206061]|uniref:hypothetical protein n=1 Tax=Micromonospora sp. CPCC 206061 TaxID=3122410 RepID=UPI002FF21900